MGVLCGRAGHVSAGGEAVDLAARGFAGRAPETLGEHPMSTDKIEARLRREIEGLERAGSSNLTLSVIVEPAGAIEPLRERMTDIGVAAMDQLILAAAIVADVTVAQIRTLADDPAVKRIIWNATEKVI
jgi:hypothetical protein